MVWHSSEVTSIDPKGPTSGRTSYSRSGGRVTAAQGATAGVRRAPPRAADWRQPPDVGIRGLSRSTLWDDPGHGADPPRTQPLRARWDPVPPPRTRVGRKRTRSQRRRSAVGWFVHHYGWRAYALPVLAALTVMTVVGVINSTGSDAVPPDTAAGAGAQVTVTVINGATSTVTVAGPGVTTTVNSADPPTTGASPAVDAPPSAVVAAAHAGTALPTPPAAAADAAFQGVTMGLLPSGAPFAKTGTGAFHVVPGTSQPFGTGADHRTFTVEVEDGIESASADQQFANLVVAILSSPRSWTGGGQFTLQRVDSGTPDFRVSLTSQMTTRRADFCGWDVSLEASCYNHALGRVVINDARWVRGAYAYGGDLDSYRVYAINHEVGHALGRQHEPCPANGALAPVMMQQSWSTSDDDIARLNPGGPVSADGKTCLANPFVTPPHAS